MFIHNRTDSRCKGEMMPTKTSTPLMPRSCETVRTPSLVALWQEQAQLPPRRRHPVIEPANQSYLFWADEEEGIRLTCHYYVDMVADHRYNDSYRYEIERVVARSQLDGLGWSRHESGDPGFTELRKLALALIRAYRTQYAPHTLTIATRIGY
jgi:hypothetical protein